MPDFTITYSTFLFKCRQTIVLHKTARWFSTNDFYFFSRLRRLKTFRREKSTRDTSVSSTREFWDLRLKTKSWNFLEVRWRPYSPKESFSEDFIFNQKEAGTKVLASQLSLNCRARRSGWVGSTTLISSAFTALLNCAEVGRRNRILTNYRFLSHSLS